MADECENGSGNRGVRPDVARFKHLSVSFFGRKLTVAVKPWLFSGARRTRRRGRPCAKIRKGERENVIHAMERQGRYLVLDVESGALHAVDRLGYDIAKVWEERGRDAVKPALAGKYPGEEIDEVLSELSELEAEGSWDAPAQAYQPLQGENVIKAMCLHVAHDCNLRCDYCFAGKGAYHSCKALMPLEVGKAALDFLMARSGDRTNLEVDFFGGEPLMNFAVVKALVAYGRELEGQFGKKIAFTMTTNCLLIDQEVVDFCREEIHNVVISLDGRREVHDGVRHTLAGGGSYEVLLPKAQALGLARQRDGQEYYVRGTFTHRNLDFAQDVLSLADAGFEQVSVEPVVLGEGDPLAIVEEDLPRIYAEYDRLADIILEREREGKWFNFFHFMVDLENGPCLAKRMSGCGAGCEYAAVTPQGEIYPCHQFVGQPEYAMGNVLTGEYDRNIRETFAACHVGNKPDCQACWAKYHCSGGCAANAVQYGGGLDKPYRLACEMQRKRLEIALDLYSME